MLPCYQKSSMKKTIPLLILTKSDYSVWLKKQKTSIAAYLKEMDFIFESGAYCCLANAHGEIDRVIVCADDEKDLWAIAHLPLKLPNHCYSIENNLSKQTLTQLAIGWGLGSYQFCEYKKPKRHAAKLMMPKICNSDEIHAIVSSIYYVRDLINFPADDLGPSELSQKVFDLGEEFGAMVTETVGEALLLEGFNGIYSVGKGCDDEPRLLELAWGNKKHPQLTLIGKGVCFDSGGLNLKPSTGIVNMHKDMGGGAHVLGLAKMIMTAKLPVYLHVFIPTVENLISGRSYHPGDIIRMKDGQTVEVTNTDAEGRLILADAIAEAVTQKPDLLIDFATLTGAARIALGTEIAALFCRDEKLAHEILAVAREKQEAVWWMPLHDSYWSFMKSDVADMANSSSQAYGGAITAALFLEKFVGKKIPWIHFDIMAANISDLPGRPKGGEAQMLRSLFEYLRRRYE